MPKFADLTMTRLVDDISSNKERDTGIFVYPNETFCLIEPYDKTFMLKLLYKQSGARGLYTIVLADLQADRTNVTKVREVLDEKKLVGKDYDEPDISSIKMHVSINNIRNIDPLIIQKFIKFLESESLDPNNNLSFKFKIINPNMSSDARFGDNDQFTIYFDKYSSTAAVLELADKIKKFLSSEQIPENDPERKTEDPCTLNPFVSLRFDANKLNKEYGKYRFFDNELRKFFENVKDVRKLIEVPLCAFEMVFNNLLISKSHVLPKEGVEELSQQQSDLVQAELRDMMANPRKYINTDQRFVNAKIFIDYLYLKLEDEFSNERHNDVTLFFKNIWGVKDHKFRAITKLKELADTPFVTFDTLQKEVENILGGPGKNPMYRDPDKTKDIDPEKVLHTAFFHSKVYDESKELFEAIRDNDTLKLGKLANDATIALSSRLKQ